MAMKENDVKTKGVVGGADDPAAVGGTWPRPTSVEGRRAAILAAARTLVKNQQKDEATWDEDFSRLVDAVEAFEELERC